MQLTETIQRLLRNQGLRKTIIREEVLSLFLSEDRALSHGEVEELFNGKFDRVTIYRTLKTFEDKGLIHRVIDDGAVVKYASCAADCDEHEHHDNHVHFKCSQCSQTFCLHDLPIEEFSLPKGFIAEDYQLLITGVCKQCNTL